MNPLWFMRMAKWARRPPSLTQVKIGAAVLAAVLVIWGVEAAGLWPDWATVERPPRVPRP